MSHHYSGPDFAFPYGDARLYLCDLFAFPKPGDERKSIIIMDVQPSVCINPPGPTTKIPFALVVMDEFKVDTNGDAVANFAYRIRFWTARGGAQFTTVRRAEGEYAARTSDGREVLVEDVAVSSHGKRG